MTWVVAVTPILLLLAALVVLRRRHELGSYARSHSERVEAKERGSDKARLQHPDIDLSQCIGCGACVRACPEEGVLDLLHGQAVVVHGARCVGHGRCAEACPTGAIALTLGDLSDRRDLPAIEEDLEAVNVPGLYLAGELTGFALVRTAVTHGSAVADAVAARVRGQNGSAAPHRSAGGDEIIDLLIVGAGPAGLACSLQALSHGLRFRTIEQADQVGGTVASYPRRKMVMTQPVELPLHGRLPRLTYQKEELVDLWESVVAKNNLEIQTGVRMLGYTRGDDGVFEVKTSAGLIRARSLCLALGRRGTPRKLGVPGEDLLKVAYSLLDAESYRNLRILVVGGGDSAVEAALGLASQPGNRVTLSYRKKAFTRLKSRNERRLQKAMAEGALEVLFESQVLEIEPQSARLAVGEGAEAIERTIPNDEVFVFAGGTPPFELLEQGGVSFDPKDRPEPRIVTEGKALLYAQMALLAGAAAMLSWAISHRSYYSTAMPLRGALSDHALLRPSDQLGLAFGIIACVMFLSNLAYLVRRSLRWGSWIPGTLRKWMGSHVFTGVASLMCVLVHSGFTLRNTVGGHALIALIIVIVAGIVGRYFYAFVPRAANGREIELDEARARLVTLSTEWDLAGRGFSADVRSQIESLIHSGRWKASLFARLGSMVSGQFRLSRTLRKIRAQGQRGDIPHEEVKQVVSLARRSYRLSLIVVHYEEIRAVLSSWRYFHRWLALLMVLLATVHIVTAIRFSAIRTPTLAAEVSP